MTAIQPLFSFGSIGEMYTCGATPINWTYGGLTTSGLDITISDVNVPQSAAPSSSSAASSSTPIDSATPSMSAILGHNTPLPRQWNGFGSSWLPAIDQIIATNLNPTLEGYTWQTVNVTQGWYVLRATLADVVGTYTSPEFFVQNGSTTACLSTSPSPSSSSSVPVSSTLASSTSTPSPTAGGSSSDNSTGGSGANRSSRTGAIVGGVIGGLAFLLALAAAAALFLLRRRNTSVHSRRAQGPSIPAPKRRATDSMQAFGTRSGGAGGYSPPHSDDALEAGVDAEKVRALEAPGFGAGPTAAPYFTPAPLRQPKRGSVASFGPAGAAAVQEAYSMRARSMSQPDVAHVDYMSGAVPSLPPMPPAPVDAQAGISPTGGTRRKPVPKYDSREFHEGSESAGASAHGLQHQSSFGSMRAMHVLMPDMPPPASARRE
ncbi:hypothetical protein K488DRAFT_72342 [Vararia minispora EC-137]|uniref:Uncharacterized protein n=1 Tax=Vararia minispora EC-137 TaxID=1314806 RepID=A0ACB8QEJ7_9AGAM|nr:hypothetical protein K488DRAFT_72342 [Vararia minispora EC-137]